MTFLDLKWPVKDPGWFIVYFFDFIDKQLLVIYFVKVVLIFGPSMLDLRFQRNYYDS